MSYANAASELIGGTPLLRLHRVEEEIGAEAGILAKIEYLNPAGSVKDRVARAMLEDAERRGLLAPGATVIEPTSGNTGIGLCAMCAARGYRAVIVMPDSMSPERRMLMRAYGAEVVLTPGAEGMKGAIAKAKALAQQTPGSLIAGQFENPANPRAHYETTGPELYADTDGKLDIFVCGIGTGGTISGVGRYLKERLPKVKIVGVEPADSPFLTKGISGAHGLQGIGAGFVPAVLDCSLIDEVQTVTTAQAYEASRLMGRREGMLVGISSGAALHVAMALAKLPENRGKTIAVLLPDGGERYLSCGLFE